MNTIIYNSNILYNNFEGSVFAMKEQVNFENKRIIFYKNILSLIKDWLSLKNDEDLYLFRYEEILSLVSRMSNKSLSGIGKDNFEKEIDYISAVFIYALKYSIKPLLNFIFKDIILVAQKYRMLKITMNQPLNNPVEDDVNKIHIWILKFIFGSYFVCRNRKTTLVQEMLFFLESIKKRKIDEEILDEIKIGIFHFAFFLFQNDVADEYLYKSTKSEKEEIILFIFELGPKQNTEKEKFYSILNEIILIYSLSFFKKDNLQKIYHITSIKNLDNIFKSNEVWFKQTKYLNDPLEQKKFFEILEKDSLSEINIKLISEKDLNNDYFSFSTTYDYPCLKLLEKYSGEVILEYDYNSSSSLFFGIKSNKYFSPMIGKVIYDENEMKHIWRQITFFLNQLKRFTSIESYVKKAANICNLFYKTKKWSDEREIRLVMLDGGFDNLIKDENHYKLKGQLLTVFENIYIDEKQHLELKDKLNKTEEKSYEITKNYVYFNDEEKDISFSDKIKTIK